MARNQQLSPYRSGEATRGVDPFTSLHREMNRLFDDAFRGFGLPLPMGFARGRGEDQQGAMALQPDIDVSETEKEFKICADLPGVTEQDVDITLDDDVLRIRARRHQEREEQQENYHLVERSYGTFQRALRLPGNINPDEVQARFENGVLTVTIPKSEEAQRTRRIQIKGGAGQQPDEAGALGAQSSSNTGKVEQNRQQPGIDAATGDGGKPEPEQKP